MIALLIAGFIVYLYTPHLLFKFAASGKYDFVRLKDVPQVEEFFSAGLPSFFLNLKTFLVANAVTWLSGGAWLKVDRDALSILFTKDQPLLPDLIRSGNFTHLAYYLALLGLFSSQSGLWYGKTAREVALAGGPQAYFDALATTRWQRLRSVVSILRYSFWRQFYAQYEQPFYPIVLRNDFAFVHTNSGLFHGVVFNADKRRDGDLEGIYLVDASKFSRKTEQECFDSGENPIRELDGPLFIKWSEILDINFPQDRSTLERKREYYAQKLREHQARKNPSWWDAVWGLLRKFRRLLIS